jgi:hypothetical protein
MTGLSIRIKQLVAHVKNNECSEKKYIEPATLH